MKNLATIKHLRSVMFQATSKYHQAVIEELKRLGVELEVVAEGYDEEDGEPKGCKVTSLGEDNESYEAIIDKIRYDESEPVTKAAIHVAWYDYKQIDQWWGLSDLIGEAADYVIDSIVWPDEMNEGEAEEEEVYLYFEEQLNDYELLGRHIAVYKSKEEVQKVFDKAVAEERAYAEENGWEIGTDKWDCFESYPEGSWGTSHSTVEWHKVKVNETASCYL